MTTKSSVRRQLFWSAHLGVLLVSIAGVVHAQESSSTKAGFKFLTLGQGAASIALGESMVARTNDPFVIGYNPAGIADIEHTQWAASSNSYIEGAVGYSSAIAKGGKTWGIGARLLTLTVDEIPLRDDPSSTPLGFYSSNSFGIGLAGARRVGKDAAIGMSADVVAERISGKTASSIIFGFGGQWQIRPDVRVGAALLHMGPDASFQDEKFNTPMTFRLGGTWSLPVEADADLAVELVSPNDGDVMWHFGGRYSFRSIVSLRAGYIAGHDTRSWSAGLGITPGKSLDWVRLDYAFAPFKDDLGESHRFGANFTL